MPGGGALTVRALTPEDDGRWEEGLAGSTQGTWLQWLPWHRCCDRLCNGSVVFGVERGGELIAGLVGLEDTIDGRRALRNNYLTAYHGLWVRDVGLRPAKVETLLAEVAAVLVPSLSERYGSWAFSNAPELCDARAFRALGCRVDVNCTPRLALREPDLMLGQIEKEARRWIRRAEESGATFEVCAPTEDDLRVFESHARLMAERQGIALARVPEGLFAQLAREVHRAGCGQLFLARTGSGEAAASVLCTWDQWRAYSFLGAATEEGMALGIPRHLDFRTFCWLHARGHRTVDLLGANQPGIIAFKKDYNAQIVPYVTISRERTAPPGRWGHLRAAAKHLLKAVRGDRG